MEFKGCTACKHVQGAKCKAFPSGIPIYFASGNPHLKVVPNQIGKYVWEADRNAQENQPQPS